MPPACTLGTPYIGYGSSTPFRMIRRRPARSVTSMSPFGSHARLHGCERPFVTTDTRIRVFRSYVVYDHGPSPRMLPPRCCATVTHAAPTVKPRITPLHGEAR